MMSLGSLRQPPTPDRGSAGTDIISECDTSTQASPPHSRPSRTEGSKSSSALLSYSGMSEGISPRSSSPSPSYSEAEGGSSSRIEVESLVTAHGEAQLSTGCVELGIERDVGRDGREEAAAEGGREGSRIDGEGEEVVEKRESTWSTVTNKCGHRLLGGLTLGKRSRGSYILRISANFSAGSPSR